MLGRRVVVYGGGNTALDVARTAKRLGATEAIIVYRRTREKMPAHDFELEEALQEGVMVKWLSTIKQAGESSITVEKMALDATGFPQPTGEFETLEADSLVLALGQDVDLSLLDGVPGLEIENGVVKVGAEHDDRPSRHLRRRRHGAFRAHGHRRDRPRQEGRPPHRRLAARRRLRRAAQARGRDVRQAQHLVLRGRAEDGEPDARHHPAPDPRSTRSRADSTRSNALFEARRCLSCGNCFECDNCYGVCPDNAVIKLGPGKRFEFNLDYCKGCGLCVAECPCGAIKMVPEAI